jgi:hypothetical protein
MAWKSVVARATRLGVGLTAAADDAGAGGAEADSVGPELAQPPRRQPATADTATT